MSIGGVDLDNVLIEKHTLKTLVSVLVFSLVFIIITGFDLSVTLFKNRGLAELIQLIPPRFVFSCMFFCFFITKFSTFLFKTFDLLKQKKERKNALDVNL